MRVLDTVCQGSSWKVERQEALIGGASYEKCGEPLAPSTLALCKEADAVFLGAVGGPRWEQLPGHVRPEAGLLRLRRELGVFANLRPVVSRPSLYAQTPYRDQTLEGVDLVIVRELTGGIYFGEKGSDGERAFDHCVYTRDEILRITRVAGQLARSRRGKVCSVDKANVLETSRLWRRVVQETMRVEFPDVEVQHVLVDAAAMYLAQRPASFDVLLMENMFGDILSDQASTLAGSLGLLPSSSRSERGPHLYEPIHGSAPDIAGQGKANPIAAILSLGMMLRDSFGQEQLAKRVEFAVEQVLQQGPWTADINAPKASSTEAVTAAICKLLKT
jgi:3-isopropylmalate dehydrogenase